MFESFQLFGGARHKFVFRAGYTLLPYTSSLTVPDYRIVGVSLVLTSTYAQVQKRRISVFSQKR